MVEVEWLVLAEGFLAVPAAAHRCAVLYARASAPDSKLIELANEHARLMSALSLDAPAGPSAGEVLVLVVEDEEDDFILLKRAFKQAGVKANLVWAKDGLEGQDYLLRAIAARRLPVSIVIDLRMKRMDGFELLQFIKSTAALEGVAVMVLTASVNPMDMARAYRLGAKSYLVKPSSLDVLANMTLAMQKHWMRSKSDPPASADGELPPLS